MSTAVEKTAPEGEAKGGERPKSTGKRRWRRLLVVLAILLVAAIVAARLALPWGVRWYVNRVIDQSRIYQGEVGDIEINLWRGSYAIHDIRLIKTTGNVPVPLFSAKRLELAVEWNAMLHRKLVGQVRMIMPELNFVDSPDASEKQSGSGGPWLAIIRDLFPFQINSVRIRNGSIHFRTYQQSRPVDVYLSQMDAAVDNLTNIKDDTAPLITTVSATALAMDQAKFEYQMKLNPFSYRPTFHMQTRLLGLDVTKVNDLSLAYGGFDFKRGWLDLVIEVDAKAGMLDGYVKPIFRNLKLFSVQQDLKEDNVIQVFWQAVLGVTELVLKNQPQDQLATVVPFRGDVEDHQPDILATVGNVLRNAFIRAYLPKLQNGEAKVGGDDGAGNDGLQFEPSKATDSASAGAR